MFTVLPLKIDHRKKTPKGGFAGAPKNAHMKYKLKLNTIISFVVFIIIFTIAEVYGLDIQDYFRGGE